MIIHVLAAICIVGLVLVQQGKGATVGAAFGSGASQTVFGSRGSGSFLLKLTIFFVVLFFSTSIALNYLASRAVKQGQIVNLPAETQPVNNIPAIPATNGKNETTTAPVTPNSIPSVPGTTEKGKK